MPVLIYKKRFNDYELHFAFDCHYAEQNALKLNNYQPDYFDSGDFRALIDNAINGYTKDVLKEYLNKNNGVYFLAVLNYFVDKIPGLFSIKFVNETDESIYYSSELK